MINVNSSFNDMNINNVSLFLYRWAVEYGYATKDRAGNYFRTDTYAWKWAPKSKGPHGPHTMRTYFEYITPISNGKYNRYYGFDNTKSCFKQVWENTRSLSRQVWDLWNNAIYELKGRRDISVNEEEQRWEERLELEEADSFISWNITYYKNERFAIPNTKFQERNDDDWRKFVDRLNFSYEEPIDKMDVKLPHYCK